MHETDEPGEVWADGMTVCTLYRLEHLIQCSVHFLIWALPPLVGASDHLVCALSTAFSLLHCPSPQASSHQARVLKPTLASSGFMILFLLVHSQTHACRTHSATRATRISRPLGRACNPLLEPSLHAAPQPITKVDLEWTRLVISSIIVSKNTVSTRRQCAGLASCGQTCN
jgi:hypothetical protein